MLTHILLLVLYTASTVLLAERLRPVASTTGETDQTRANNTWDRAIALLQAYSHVAESAQRCLVALQILSAKSSGESSLLNQRFQDVNHADAPETAATQGLSGVLVTPLLRSADELTAPFDFSNLDFEIDDMFWLNDSVGEIMF